MIYFIKSESGHVKIGYSENGVESRLLSLQCGCPFKLILLKTVDFEREQESLIHRKFKKFRRQGEWFELSGEITDYIDNPYKIIKPIKAKKKERAERISQEHIPGRIYFDIQKIEKEMERIGWSVAKLAEMSSLSRQTIYDRLQNENGGNIQTIEKIAKALDVDPKDLLI